MIYDCPFCHHNKANHYRWNQELRNGSTGDIYMCSECGILYPRPRMDRHEAMDYLSRFHTNQKDFHFENLTIVNRQEQKNVKKWLSPLKEQKGKALDVGTFTGKFCCILESFGFDAYGIEPQKEASEYAMGKGLKVFTGSFPDEIPLELQGKYKLISIMEAIYYFIDLNRSLLKVNEMLESDGFLLIKCHQGMSRYYNERNNSFFKRYGDYVQGIPTLNSLSYCLEKTGFEIVHISGETLIDIDNLYRGNIFDRLNSIWDIVSTKTRELIFHDIRTSDRLIVLARKIDR